MFITKQDLFKDHTDAVVVTVFSDHIGAFGIHKKEGTAEVWGMAEEAQELLEALEALMDLIEPYLAEGGAEE